MPYKKQFNNAPSTNWGRFFVFGGCMEVVTVCGARVAKMPGKVTCSSCRCRNDIERVFRAAFSAETSTEAERLVSSTPPVVRCIHCEGDIAIRVSVSQRRYDVPVQRLCSCGAETDLRFSRDSNRVKFMARWPHLPFVYCRRCRRKLVFPTVGQNWWRMTAFNLLHRIRIWKGVHK